MNNVFQYSFTRLFPVIFVFTPEAFLPFGVDVVMFNY